MYLKCDFGWGHILRFSWKNLIFFTLYVIIIFSLYHFLKLQCIDIPNQSLFVISIAIARIGFKNSQRYDRFWVGKKNLEWYRWLQ